MKILHIAVKRGSLQANVPSRLRSCVPNQAEIKPNHPLRRSIDRPPEVLVSKNLVALKREHGAGPSCPFAHDAHHRSRLSQHAPQRCAKRLGVPASEGPTTERLPVAEQLAGAPGVLTHTGCRVDRTRRAGSESAKDFSNPSPCRRRRHRRG